MFITKCSAPTPEPFSCTRYFTFEYHHPSLMEAIRSHCYQLIVNVHPAHPRLDPSGKYLHYQLHPLWQSSGEYPASKVCHLTSPLKTYGEGSSLSFSCQHGPVECEVSNKDLKVRGYAPTGRVLFCASRIEPGVIFATRGFNVSNRLCPKRGWGWWVNQISIFFFFKFPPWNMLILHL